MASGVTVQSLKRLSKIPDRPSEYDGGTLLAGQEWDNVQIGGGTIEGVILGPLDAPLGIADGGTGQITANLALNALLPSQATHSGQFLKTDGTNTSWFADTDTGITQLTGDGTAGPGSGSQVFTLATVNANVGTFGSASAVPVITANGKGLGTAYSTVAVVAPAGTLSGTTLNATVVTSSLTSVGTLSSLTLGGTLAMGTNNITSTGSLGATGARLLKGWFTDLQVTNAIAGSVTGNAATVTTNANLTGAVTSVGNATSLGSFTSAQLATALTDETGSGANVFATSPALVTPALGVATATSINFGGTTLANFVEGSYTPTLNNTTNIAASTPSITRYTRFGNTVTVWGTVSIQCTTNGVASVLGFSLPVPSNFANTYDAGGLATGTVRATQTLGVQADATNDRASFIGLISNAQAGAETWSFAFTYIVI